MKLWLSGIVEADIGEPFRIVLNEIEAYVNETISVKNFGDGLNEWDLIFVITEEGSNEFVKYNKKDKSTDIRIAVNHENFLNSNLAGKRALLWEGLLKSLSMLEMKKIENVNWVELKNYIQELSSGDNS